MGSIPLKQLRRNLGKVLRSGKPVIVTRRGEPVAKILPFKKKLSTAEALDLIDRTSGSIDDPKSPGDASVRLNDYLYGPQRSRR